MYCSCKVNLEYSYSKLSTVYTLLDHINYRTRVFTLWYNITNINEILILHMLFGPGGVR